MPTPPATCNAPEFVPVLAVTFDITNVVVVPVPLAPVLPLTNGVPFNVTDPVELTINVQVPDTNDVALTALATNVPVLNASAYEAVVANELVVALTACVTNVPVLKLRAYEAVVANELVVALTALATNVPVLNASAYEAVVANELVVALTALATNVPVLKLRAYPLVVAIPVKDPTNNVAVIVPPTYTPPAMPTPPETVNAPVVVDVDAAVPLTINCVSIVAVPYILVPDKSFAMIFYLFFIFKLDYKPYL